MSNHITEEIPRLLTGEANRDAVMDAAEHLRSCPDCQQELVSAVVAHASLTSAHRFAPEIVAPPPNGEDEDRGVQLGGERAAPDSDNLPPLTNVFAKVREEAEITARKRARAPKRHRLIAVAAAAIVLTGGGVTIAEVATSSSHQSSTHSVALTAFDRGKHSATVEILGGRTLRINAAKLPRLDSSHVYELWLTDAARKHMQSVGVLGNDNKANFTVSPKVLSQYHDLEVSVQRTNQTKYSGISVLRGSYT